MDGQEKLNEDSLRRELDRRILEDCERDAEMLRIDRRITETVSLYIDEILRQVGRPDRTDSNLRGIKELERELDSLNELKSMIRLTIDDKEDDK